jgi:phage head maturation protease
MTTDTRPTQSLKEQRLDPHFLAVRMVSTVETRTEPDGRKTLRGVFTPFNEWSHIQSWEGNFYERSVPGAYKRTISQSWDAYKRVGRHNIVVNYNHGIDGAIGSKQLGAIRVLEERQEGPYYEVLLLDTEYNREYIIPAAEDGLLGASYRFGVPPDGDVWESSGPNGDVDHRTITEASVFEFGPVDHPAFKAATAGIRSAEEYQWWLNLDDEGRADLARLIHKARSIGTSVPDLRDLEPAAITEAEPVSDTLAEESDSSPVEAPVDTQEAEPVFEMPVRQLDVDAIRATAQAYVERAAAIR